jgi:hypothetical protein
MVAPGNLKMAPGNLKMAPGNLKMAPGDPRLSLSLSPPAPTFVWRTTIANNPLNYFGTANNTQKRVDLYRAKAIQLGVAGNKAAAIAALKQMKTAETARDTFCARAYGAKALCETAGAVLKHGADYDASGCTGYLTKRLSDRARGESVSHPSKSSKRALPRSVPARKAHLHERGGPPSAADFRAAAVSGDTVTVISADRVYNIWFTAAPKKQTPTAFNPVERDRMRGVIGDGEWPRQIRAKALWCACR